MQGRPSNHTGEEVAASLGPATETPMAWSQGLSNSCGSGDGEGMDGGGVDRRSKDFSFLFLGNISATKVIFQEGSPLFLCGSVAWA